MKSVIGIHISIPSLLKFQKKTRQRKTLKNEKKNLKIVLPHDPTIPAFIWKRQKLQFEKIHAPQCSEQHYSQ